MAEASRYDMDRDAGEQQSRGVQVTKIMKPRVGEALMRLSECLVVAVDQLGHEGGDGIGILGSPHLLTNTSPSLSLQADPAARRSSAWCR